MSDDSFASLFEAQASDATKFKSVRVGQTIEGTIFSVTRDAVFIELDGKRQAFMDIGEVRNAEGNVDVKEGDKIVAKVLSVDEMMGNIRVGRSMGRANSVAAFEQARDARIAIEGKVAGVNKGGLEIDLGGGHRGFCPMSQISTRFTQDANSLVGQKMAFMVTEIKDGGKSIVVSRRAVIEEESKAGREQLLANLEKGKLVRGTVTAVRDFGAFVDLGGLEALIPASEVSYERKGAVADILKAGDEVEAQVLEIKVDEKGVTKVSLSLKALSPKPETAAKPRAPKAGFSIGQVVTGSVNRIEAYGVFVQIEGAEGREGRGLIPAAELGVPRGTDLRKVFPEGTKLTAKVLETGDGKLKLSVKGAKDAAERAEFEAHLGKSSAPQGLGTFGDLLKKSRK